MSAEKLPSIFNPVKGEKVSKHYQFVDTSSVISALEQQGFQVRTANQKGTGSSARHLVRMLNTDIDFGGGNKLELLLRNAHDGTSSFQIFCGVMVKICSNGLCTFDEQIQPVTLRHSGEGIQKMIKDALLQLDQHRIVISEQIDAMQEVDLNDEMVIQMGKEALSLVYPGKTDRYTAENALAYSVARHDEQRTNTVWNVMNRLQESALRGGHKLAGMRRQSRAVKNLDKDLSLNQQIWNLGVAYSKVA